MFQVSGDGGGKRAAQVFIGKKLDGIAQGNEGTGAVGAPRGGEVVGKLRVVRGRKDSRPQRAKKKRGNQNEKDPRVVFFWRSCRKKKNDPYRRSGPAGGVSGGGACLAVN